MPLGGPAGHLKRDGPLQRNRPNAIEPEPVQERMTASRVDRCPPKDEPPAGWGITLRLMLLVYALMVVFVLNVAAQTRSAI